MITIICGHIRRGKTSLMTALALENAQNGEKRAKMLSQAANLRRAGYNVVGEKFALYSNYNIIYHNIGVDIFSTPIDPYKLACDDAAELFIRPFSTLAIAEGQQYFSARSYHRFTPRQSAFFETCGHFGLDIYIDCQRGEIIDPAIRNELVERFIYVERRTIYDENGRPLGDGERANKYNFSRIVWNCVEFTSYNEFEKRKNGRLSKYQIDYNVYDCYNSYNHYQSYLPLDKKHIII